MTTRNGHRSLLVPITIMIKVLSIAGSDPSSGAGMQVDLKTFQALGVFGMAVPAALTVQNSRRVRSVQSVPYRALADQLAAILADIRPDAIKTGMLLTKRNVDVVANAIAKFRTGNLVIDPVLRSSSGSDLLKPDAVSAMKKQLFPLARVITPNLPEAGVLAGMAIRSQKDMDFAAGKLLDMGPSFVLIKGGHARGAATDTLYGGKTVLSFSTTRRKGEFHGTGCVLSSAIAVFIAGGHSVDKAVEKAKQFVDNLLKRAKPVGKAGTKYFQF